MPDYVRVKQKETGHELSVPVGNFEAAADGYSEVDKAAVDAAGDPLPPKYKTTVAKSASAKKAAEPANTDEGVK